jgi:hypothetical protein
MYISESEKSHSARPYGITFQYQVQEIQDKCIKKFAVEELFEE